MSKKLPSTYIPDEDMEDLQDIGTSMRSLAAATRYVIAEGLRAVKARYNGCLTADQAIAMGAFVPASAAPTSVQAAPDLPATPGAPADGEQLPWDDE